MRRLGSALVYVLGFAFAATALIAVLVGWRLSQGPVRVSFLSPWLQESVEALPEGWSIAVGDTFIDWDGVHQTFNVRVEDLGFINNKQQRVISVPAASFSLRGDTLLRGRAEPRYAAIHGMSLLVTRSVESNWFLGLGATSEESEDAGPNRDVGDLAQDLFGRVDDTGTSTAGVLGRLEELSLTNTVITVVDRPRGKVYRFDEANLVLKGVDSGIDISADTVFRAREATLPLKASLVYQPGLNSLRGALRFRDLRLPQLIDALDAPEIFLGFDFPLSGTIGFQVSDDGDFGPMPVKVEAGEGSFDLPGGLAAPVPVKRFSLDGMIRPAERRLEVATLHYDAGTFEADATGQVSITEAGPWIALQIDSKRVPLTRVPDYWPPERARIIRQWLFQHVRAGTGLNVSAKIDLRPDLWSKPVPDADSFDISFDFEEADIALYAPFEAISAASGHLRVTGRSLDITGINGIVNGLSLTDGNVKIDDFSLDRPDLTTGFVTSGTIAETVSAVLRGPLENAAVDKTLLSGVEGVVAARVDLTIPVASSTQLTDAQFVANANLGDVIVGSDLAGVPLTSDQLTLKLDRKGAELTGNVQIAGGRADVQWVEHFRENIPIFRQIALTGTIETASAAGFAAGIDDFVQGTLDISGTAQFHQDGMITADVSSDVSKAAVSVPGLRWGKPSGVPGAVALSVAQLPDGSVNLTQINALSDLLHIVGDVSLDPTGAPRSVRLERADLGANRLSVVARRREDDALFIQLVGAHLDLRPWQTEAGDGQAPDWLEGATVSMAFDKLMLDDSLTFHDAVGDFVMGDPLPVGTLRGLLGGKAGVSVETRAVGNSWQFDMRSSDAGNMISAMGLGDSIRKGLLTITGTRSADGKIIGLAKVEDFSLTETPTFARLFSLASFTGIGEALSGRGLSFTRAELPFTYGERRLDFQKARMAGPSVGLTADGFYHFDRRELRVVGNLIPAYSLSQVLGAIPLLGTILGGDQGLFGVTYAIEGTAENPTVTVNPLSALAPGILRRMFLEPVDPVKAEGPPSVEVIDER